MATHLDLEQQEQIDQLKSFWKRYGGLIVWVLIAVFGGVAAWNGWNWWQREQSVKASALYEELDKAAQAGNAERATQVFNDIKERYPRTVYAEQAGLLAAKVQLDQGKTEDASASLAWVGDNAREAEYKTVARLRLAAVLLEQKKYDEALKQLDGATAKTFEALVADRRGDVLSAQGKTNDAVAAYRKAWELMAEEVDYRRLVEAKLTALGAAPQPKPAGSEATR